MTPAPSQEGVFQTAGTDQPFYRKDDRTAGTAAGGLENSTGGKTVNKKAPIPGQFRNGPPALGMTKREFMQQYVLNRAANIADSVDSMFLVYEAEEVWTAIERQNAA